MLVAAVNRVGVVRRAVENGRRYLVAPVTMIVPGVLSGSLGPLYYPPEEVLPNASVWDGTPLVLNHPTDSNGDFVSASLPHVYERHGLGFVRNATGENGRLAAEAWFDVMKTRKVSERVYQALIAGRRIEVSTGIRTARYRQVANGSHNGVRYTHTVHAIVPDHLAVLPDSVGACSLADGCGVLANGRNAVSRNLLRRLARALGVANREVSYGDVEEKLKSLLTERFAPKSSPGGPMPYCEVEDVFPGHVVYEVGEKTYRIGYAVDPDSGGVSLEGEPEEVEEVTTYEPVTNPYPHEHAARMMSPGSFVEDSFRRKEIAPGVSAVFAKKTADGPMMIQAYRFDAKRFTAEEARKWLRDHEVSPMGFEAASAMNENVTRNNEVHNMLSPDQKRGIVAGLLANCSCQFQTPWKGKDEAALNALSDDVLSAYDEMRKAMEPVFNNFDGYTDTTTGIRYVFNKTTNQWAALPPLPVAANPPAPPAQPTPAVPPAPQPVANNVPVAQPVTVTVKPRTLQEWLDVAPPEGRAAWNQFQEELSRQKAALIEALVANAEGEARDRLVGVYNGMDLPHLRVLAEAVPQTPPPQAPAMNYLGMGGPPVGRPAPVTQEPLLPPVYNFARN